MKTGVTAEVKKTAVVEEEEVPLMLMDIAEAKKEVAVVVEESWRLTAPKRLTAEFDAG